jgi:hypothetical protein
MTDNAAAIAPATDEVVEIETPIEAVEELSEDDILSAAFDDIQNQEEEPLEVETPAEPVDETPVEAEPVATVEVPSDLPGGVKAEWANLTEGQREAFLTSHRDLSAKYSQASRDLQGIGPIRDAVMKAAQEIPGVSDMTPQQLAGDLYQLAKVAQSIRTDPQKAIMGLAKQHGVTLGEQPAEQPDNSAKVVSDLQQQIAGLQNQLQTTLDPNKMRENFSAWDSERALVNEVNQFSADKEHWSAVEQHLPTTIPVAQAKLGANAAPQAVLQEAYEMAVNTFVPNARASEVAGEEPAPQDPQRVKAAVKAKSVNVTGKQTGKPKPLTEDEALSATWDRLNKD